MSDRDERLAQQCRRACGEFDVPDEPLIYVIESMAFRLREAERALGVLGIRVLQSDLVLDEAETQARDLGVELHCATLQETDHDQR